MLGNHIPQEMIIDLGNDDKGEERDQQEKVGEAVLGDGNIEQEKISRDFYGLKKD